MQVVLLRILSSDRLAPARATSHNPSVGLVERLAGASRRYKLIQDDVAGQVLAYWVGALMTRSGLSLTGGTVVVTEEHLVFWPIPINATRGLAIRGQDVLMQPVTDKAGVIEPIAVPLTTIVSVEVLNRASLLRAPCARLTLNDGSQLQIGILASQSSWNIDPVNNIAFDDWLARLPVDRHSSVDDARKIGRAHV